MFLSLIEVLNASKKVVDNMPNRNPHINKLAEQISVFRKRHTETAREMLKFLAEIETLQN